MPLIEPPTKHCPDCGDRLTPNVLHNCGVPILRETIGLELGEEEMAIVRWIAKLDDNTIGLICGMFRKARNDAVLKYRSAGIPG
jgi:hypothetical protein